MNRARLLPYVKNKKVLDVFSYIGAWGILAAKYDASEVVCVDSSQPALTQLLRNAELNGVKHLIKTLQGDAFDILSSLKESFDVIILDPPAFIKKRKDSKEGLYAYQRINELALRLLNPQGILISASCSMHLAREDLLNILRRAAVKQGRNLSIIEQGHQGPDHPIHPAIPETEYLKAFYAILNL
jgi:23S rRNA (cytosine1962-C5)-methyltransferase